MNQIATDYPFAPVSAAEAAERYRAIAADRPMTKVTMPFGGDAWVIHRTEAARAMLGDPRFVREPFRTGERVVPYFVEFPEFLRKTLQFEDPPHHTKLRRLVQKAISPKQVRAMREGAVAYANSLIDEMVAKGDTAALPLSIQLLCTLLGVPPEDHDKFEKWASSTLAVAGMSEEEVVANMGELYMYVVELIQLRRREPLDDLISSLANARDKDDTLTDEEILPIAMLLVVAGFDNTANFITTGIASLLQHPAQLELFLTDPDGLAPTATEETLRHGRFSLGIPVAGGGALVPFVATEDVEIDGQLVATGEAIMIDPGATAHDGIALADAEKFDITRQNNPQLTLSYGLHHCLGAPLARMEMQVALAELFKRLPQIRLTSAPVINHDHLSQPITHLDATW
jgi:cytochrome P450